MKTKKLYYLLLLPFFAFSLAACSDDDTTGGQPAGNTPEATIDGSTFFELQGYENAADGFNTLKPGDLDDPIYIQEGQLTGSAYLFATTSASRLDALDARPADDVWNTSAEVAEGKCYWIRHTSTLLYTYLKLRIAYIEGNNVGVEYIIDSTEQRDPSAENTNANQPLEGYPFVTDLSIPHTNTAYQYIEHTVESKGQTILNYALEWDSDKKHSVWVAFSFDAETCLMKVSRPDEEPYAEDPELETGDSPTEDNHRRDGFDKGHLVASNDRLFSREANNQTFYYTNISPMMSDFNGGVWSSFEIQLQSWARSGDFDKLYVTKGGTIDQLLTDFTGTQKGNDGIMPHTDEAGLTIHGLACPRFYFMAILAQKGEQYQALGFWVEHRDDYGHDYNNRVPVSFVKEKACSIDQLEQETGLDFFCNLPDEVETQVEEAYDEQAWQWSAD